VCSNVGLWAMAMVSGDGSIGWSKSKAEAVDGVSSGTSMGLTYIGDSGHGCSTGAGSGGTATGDMASVTGGMNTAGAMREASGS
jgi:hypothetical protein